MNQQFSYSHTQLDKVMTREQFEQIVAAILDGKYSWACVLILRFAGYNPLHYIPYRTYNRLMKDNRQLSNSNSNDQLSTANSKKQTSQKSAAKISDLSYLEKAKEQYSKVNGGNRRIWISYIDLDLDCLAS